jgi:hypothetical protein
MKKYCFIHSCNLFNNKSNILNYLIEKIINSKLIDELEEIFIYNIGIPLNNNEYDNNKINIINYSENINLFENPTINKIKAFSDNNPNCYILYLHTKGISYDQTTLFYTKINDWIELMIYFLIDQFKICFEKMNENYDTIGCNLNDDIHNPKHYSGNFWWASTNYIKTLPYVDEINPHKMTPEFWLLQNLNAKCHVLHNSNVDHYLQNYPKYLYS